MVKPKQPTSYLLKWMCERKRELEKELKAKRDAEKYKVAD